MSLDEEFECLLKEFEKDYNISHSEEEIDSIRENYFIKFQYYEDKIELLNKFYQATLYHYFTQYYIFNLNKPEKVIYYCNKAIEVLTENNTTSSTSIFYFILGSAYSKLSKDQEALDSFQKAAFLSINTKNIKGRCLYSFRTVNKYFLQDLINNEISVTSPVLFNDPVDCPIFSLVEREKTKNNSDNRHLLKAYGYIKLRCFISNYDTNRKVKRDGLEEEYKNFLMWSHYADSHRGVCVKYNLHEFFFNSDATNKTCTTIYDVEYSNSLLQSDSGIIKVQQAFATKQQCWEYENEVRLLHYDPNCDSLFKALPLGENGNVEAVFFGLRCPEKDVATIRGILGEDVAFFQMKEDEEDIFKLVEVPLNEKAKAMLEATREVETEIVD